MYPAGGPPIGTFGLSVSEHLKVLGVNSYVGDSDCSDSVEVRFNTDIKDFSLDYFIDPDVDECTGNEGVMNYGAAPGGGQATPAAVGGLVTGALQGAPDDTSFMSGGGKATPAVAGYHDDPPGAAAQKKAACVGGYVSDLSLYADCKTITGFLAIVGTDENDLNDLKHLTAIVDDPNMAAPKGIGLHIKGNANLDNINGLRNLHSVAGGIAIDGNPLLRSTLGLGENLQHIGVNVAGEMLTIKNNPQLADVGQSWDFSDGVAPGSLTLEENAVLANIHGLHTVQEVGGGVRISGNKALVSLAGLEQLAKLGKDATGNSLTIRNNDNLKDTSAVHGVQSVSGSVEIANNPKLVHPDRSGLSIGSNKDGNSGFTDGAIGAIKIFDNDAVEEARRKGARKGAVNSFENCVKVKNLALNGGDKPSTLEMRAACKEDAKTMFLEAGGDGVKFEGEMTKAARDKASNLLKGCLADAVPDLKTAGRGNIVNACQTQATEVFVAAGGSGDEYQHGLAQAAREQVSDKIQGCVADKVKERAENGGPSDSEMKQVRAACQEHAKIVYRKAGGDDAMFDSELAKGAREAVSAALQDCVSATLQDVVEKPSSLEVRHASFDCQAKAKEAFLDAGGRDEDLTAATCPRNGDINEVCSAHGHCPDDREHKGSKCKCDDGYVGEACERAPDSSGDERKREMARIKLLK